MRHARNFVVALMLVVLIVPYAIAGGQGEAASTEIPVGAELVTSERIGNPNAPNVIRFASRQTLSHESPQAALNEHLIAAFEDWARRNPSYQIEVEIMPGGGADAMARLLEQAASGQAADFALIDSFFAGRFYPFLQPLDDFVDSDELADFVPFAQEVMVDSTEGSVKLLYFTTDNRVLWYREDLVPEPPQTWEELIQVASGLAQDGYDGYLFAGGRGEGTTMLSYPYVWMTGAELIDRETGRPIFNEPGNREGVLNVMHFLRELVESGASPSRVTTYANAGAYNPDIATGNVAMFIHGSWMVDQIFDIIDDQEIAGQYRFAPLPRPSLDHPTRTSVGGWTAGVFTSDVEEQAVIVDFLQTAYTGREGMAGLVAGGALLPVRASVFESGNPYYARQDVVDFFQMLLDGGQTRPGSAPIYPTVSEEYAVAVSGVLAGDVTPEQALERAWEAVMREYRD